MPSDNNGPYVMRYNDYGEKGKAKTLEVDLIIDAGDYDYAIAFQERIKISDEQMKRYEEMAEMYVGDDVSPDFYGWVFPKYDHVGVGTGSVMDKTGIRKYQTAIRDRCGPKIEGGKVIKVEAHPIPEHPR